MKWQDKRKIYHILLVVVLLLAYFARAKHINLPLLNAHYFRQTQTATVTRNFYRYGIDLFQPRLDVFGTGDKEVLALEFPFFQGIVAVLYHIFGFHDYVGRMTAIIWGVIAASFLYKLVVHFTGNFIWALVSVTFFLFSPLNLFFNQAFMVESSVVGLHLISMYVLLRLLKNNSLTLFFVFVLVMSVALIAKIIYAPILLGTLTVLYVIGRKKHAHIDRKILMGIVACLVVLVAWQRYADVTNVANGHAFFTSGNSGQLLWNIGTVEERLSPTIWKTRLHDILAGLSKPFVLAILLGILTSIVNFQKTFSKYCLSFIIISGVYYLTFFRIQSHPYYLMPMVPLFSIVSGYGITQTALLLSKKLKKKWLVYTMFTIFLCFFSIKSIVNAQPYFAIDSQMEKTLETIGSHLSYKGPGVLVLPDYDWNSVYSYYLDRKLLYVGASELTETSPGSFREQGYEYIIVEGLPDVLQRNKGVKALLSQLSTIYEQERIGIYLL